jgi:hypothetical protein
MRLEHDLGDPVFLGEAIATGAHLGRVVLERDGRAP